MKKTKKGIADGKRGPVVTAFENLTLPSTSPNPPMRLRQILGQAKLNGTAEHTGRSLCLPEKAGAPPALMTLPFDWSADPFDDRNWCARLHMWTMLDDHLLAFENGDRGALVRAKQVALDWHRFHLAEKRQSGPLSWGNKRTGERAARTAYIISQWQHGKLPLEASEKRAFEELAQTHLSYLLSIGYTYSNHTFYQLIGAMALATVVDDESAAQARAIIGKEAQTLLERQFDANGIHLENSFGYQGFGINMLKLLGQTRWFKDQHVPELIEKAERMRDWMMLPDGRVAPIGDTDGRPPAEAVDTAFKRGGTLLNESGYCVVRADGGGKVSNASYLLFMGAFNSKPHKHADDLSIFWFEGEEILIDPGKYSYNHDAMREYARSTRAHNTVEIDERSFSTLTKDIYGSAITEAAATEWGYRLSGRVQHKQPGVTHTRTCLYAPGQWLLLVDWLASREKHRYTRWLQLSPSLECVLDNSDGQTIPLRSGKSLRILTRGGQDVAFSKFCGAEKPRLQGWASQKYGTVVPTVSLGATQDADNAVFATLLVIDGGDSAIEFNGTQLRPIIKGRSTALNVGIPLLAGPLLID